MASGKVFLITICSLLLLSQLMVLVHSKSCCLKYTRRSSLPCKRLLNYKVQNITNNCDINAVIFHQTDGKLVCADPLSPHTQRGIKCIKQRREREAKAMAEMR